jgi:hypothetical protein
MDWNHCGCRRNSSHRLWQHRSHKRGRRRQHIYAVDRYHPCPAYHATTRSRRIGRDCGQGERRQRRGVQGGTVCKRRCLVRPTLHRFTAHRHQRRWDVGESDARRIPICCPAGEGILHATEHHPHTSQRLRRCAGASQSKTFDRKSSRCKGVTRRATKSPRYKNSQFLRLRMDGEVQPRSSRPRAELLFRQS